MFSFNTEDIYKTVTREQAINYACDVKGYSASDFDECRDVFEVLEQLAPLDERGELFRVREYHGLPAKITLKVYKTKS